MNTARHGRNRLFLWTVVVLLFLSLESHHGLCALEIVKDGKAVACMVTPDQPAPPVTAAAGFLQEAWQEASGVKVEIVAESKAPANTSLVALGATQLAQQAGITAGGLKPDQYRIRVVGKNLFLVGMDTSSKVAQRKGTLQAALALLREVFGVRWLAPTRMGMRVPRSPTLSVPDNLALDSAAPSFQFAVGRFGYNNAEHGYWGQVHQFTGAGLYICGGHSWTRAFPDEFLKANTDFVAETGGKRTPPGGGNPMLCTSHPDFVSRTTRWVQERFEEGYDLVELGQSDGYSPCQCERCNKTFGDWKTPEGKATRCLTPHRESAMRLVQSHPDKRVMILAYDITLMPPKDFPKMPDNVIVELAPPAPAAMAAWAGKANTFTAYVYTWGEYHTVGLGPMNRDLAELATMMRDLHKADVRGLYYCGGDYNWGLMGPQYYVTASLQSNIKADEKQLLKEYCEGLYGNAAATMQALFTNVYERTKDFITLTESIPNGARDETPEAVYTFAFPPEVVSAWQGMLDKAKQEAAGDERALGWLRATQISLDHIRHLSNGFHAWRVYKMDPGTATLELLIKHVAARNQFNQLVRSLGEKEPAFIGDFFPNYPRFVRYLESNGTSRATLKEPFNLDLKKLLEERTRER